MLAEGAAEDWSLSPVGGPERLYGRRRFNSIALGSCNANVETHRRRRPIRLTSFTLFLLCLSCA